jgi:hypothetical protein
MVLALTVVGVIGAPANAAPVDPKGKVCEGIMAVITGGCDTSNMTVGNVWQIAADVVGYILMAVGIICVLFIIWGGIRYATSGGDAEKVKNAKNTLLYAIIGLAICILAGAITGLVTSVLADLQATPTP